MNRHEPTELKHKTVALGIFLVLPAFQHAILVRPRQNNLLALGKIFTVGGQPDFVFECGIAIRQELFVADKTLKLDFVEHQHALNFNKEMLSDGIVFQQ